MTYQPALSNLCSDCGTHVEPHAGDMRCPACFDNYLYEIDAGFLESYRKFGCRARLVVAETCLRGLVVAAPDHRKILAMTILEQYVQSMNDLAGIFYAFQHRHERPIISTFLEFRLDQQSATHFFDTVRSLSDAEILNMLGLPLPGQAPQHARLNQMDSYQLAIATYQLVQELRKATEQGDIAAMALAQIAGSSAAAVLAGDAKWLNGQAAGLTPDQVAMVVLDTKRRGIYVQGLTADEGAMGRVVDAVDTCTRAASNLIYAYLQAHDL